MKILSQLLLLVVMSAMAQDNQDPPQPQETPVDGCNVDLITSHGLQGL